MIIKKYLAKTEKDAIEKAKEELGSNAIVMNVKKVHPRGIMRIFLRAKVEVTAALDENTNYTEEKPQPKTTTVGDKRTKFDVSIPPLEGLPPLEAPGKGVPKPSSSTSGKADNEGTNEERLSQLLNLLEKQMTDKNVSTAANGTKARSSAGTSRDDSRDGREPVRREPVRREEPARREEPIRRDSSDRRAAQARDDREEKEEIRKRLNEASKESRASDRKDTDESDREEADNPEKKDKGAIYRDLIYKKLIQNEVDESIADAILDEAKRALPKDAAVDQILGSVYQRIILMIGQPYTINYKPNEPTKFIFFLGSTGVGKTTTIAKLASRLKLEQNCKLALVTADTYRVAAVEQLRVYADILSVPLHVIYHPEELEGMLDDLQKYDVVLVDTAGCSHKNTEQIDEIQTLLEQVPISKRLVYLCLSAGTKYRDLKEIANVYSEITDYSIIFTKLDETLSAGVVLNMKVSTKCPLSYVTNGQNVPDDISRIDAQAIAKQLMS